MTLYFITLKTSETGKKFQAISKKREEVQEAVIAFANKYDFTTWRPSRWSIWGGISSCTGFKENPDPKIWGKGLADGEFFPKQNSKAGKAIYDEIQALPVVSKADLNQCVDFDGAPFSHIGFGEDNAIYFGFTVIDEWKIKIPEDCKEVTGTEYKKLFRD